MMEFYNKHKYKIHFGVLFLLVFIPLGLSLPYYGLIPVEGNNYNVDGTMLYYELYFESSNELELLLWTDSGTLEVDIVRYQSTSSGYTIKVNANIKVTSKGLRVIAPYTDTADDVDLEVFEAKNVLNNSIGEERLGQIIDDEYGFSDDAIIAIDFDLRQIPSSPEAWTLVSAIFISMLALTMAYAGLTRTLQATENDLSFRAELQVMLSVSGLIVTFVLIGALSSLFDTSVLVYLLPLVALLVPITIFFQIYSAGKAFTMVKHQKYAAWNFVLQLVINVLSVTYLDHYQYGQINYMLFLFLILLVFNFYMARGNMKLWENIDNYQELEKDPRAYNDVVRKIKLKFIFSATTMFMLIQFVHIVLPNL